MSKVLDRKLTKYYPNPAKKRAKLVATLFGLTPCMETPYSIICLRVTYASECGDAFCCCMISVLRFLYNATRSMVQIHPQVDFHLE